MRELIEKAIDDPKVFVDWANLNEEDPVGKVARAIDRTKVLGFLELVNPHLSNNPRQNTSKSYSSDTAHFLAWCVTKGFRLSQITAHHISQYIFDRSGTSSGTLCPRSMNRNLVSIRHLFEAMNELEPEVYANNPVRRRHFSRSVSKPNPRPLNFRLAMEFISTIGDLADRALFSFILFTGCRECEIADIRYKDTDLLLEDGKEILEITIRNGKGGNSRKTYLGGPGLEVLREYSQVEFAALNREPALEDLLLANHVRLPWKERRIRKRFALVQDQVSRSINTTGWTVHRFRHTLLSAMGEAEMSVYSMQSISGHKDLNSLLHYVEAQESKMRAAYHLAARRLCE